MVGEGGRKGEKEGIASWKNWLDLIVVAGLGTVGLVFLDEAELR